MTYAKGTKVSVEKTEMDIKQLLREQGASSVVVGWQNDLAVVMFEMDGRRVRFSIPIPSLNDFSTITRGFMGEQPRTQAEKKAAHAQAQREKWRSIYLLIKAKLEALNSKASIFEEEFLSHVVMPNGQTVGEWLAPQLEDVYRSGKMPPMLPGASIALPPPKE